jgi:hypothetical protein
MTVALVAASGAVLIGWPGWVILRIGRGSTRLSPVLAIPASFGLGLSLIAAAGWSAYLLHLGFRGAAAISYGFLVLTAVATTAIAASPLLRRPPPRPDGVRRIPSFELIMAIEVAAVVAAVVYTGPWLSATADSFYHLAAARSLATYGNPLPQQIFFPAPDRFPDPSSGAWHLALALIAQLSQSDLTEVWRVANLVTAGLTTLAFGALALVLTRSRTAAVVAAALYTVIGVDFDFRAAAYPNRFGLLLAWLALAFGHRYAAGREPSELLRAILLGFGASAIHPSATPLLIVVLGGGAILAGLRPSRTVARLGVAALLTLAAALPIFAFQYLLISHPPSDAAAAQSALPLAVVHLRGIPLISPGFWFSDPAVSVATLLSPVLVWAWWRRETGAASILAALGTVPVLGLIPQVAVSSSTQYALIRVAQVVAPLAYVGWAWAIAVAVGLLRDHRPSRQSRRQPRSLRSRQAEARPAARWLAWPGAAALAVSGLVVGVTVEAGPVSLYQLQPVVAKSVVVSRSGDLTRGWRDLLAAVDVLPPRAVVLTDPDTAFELAGLTGHPVVGVTASHMPVQDEFRDGPVRRGDSLDLLDGYLEPAEAAGILEQYRAGYVLSVVNSDQGPLRPGQAAIFAPLASGTGWTLYRYDRSALADFLGLAAGLTPTSLPAGRAVFIRPPGAVPAGSRTITARDGAGDSFSAAVAGGPVMVLPVPSATPVGHYQLELEVGGGDRRALGSVDVGHELQVETFAGVLLAEPLSSASSGWVAIDGGPFHARQAAATTALGREATHLLDAPLPATTYCLRARVQNYGGPDNEVRVSLGNANAELRWGGAVTGQAWVEGEIAPTAAAGRVALRAVILGQPYVIVDAVAIYPREACAGAP